MTTRSSPQAVNFHLVKDTLQLTFSAINDLKEAVEYCNKNPQSEYAFRAMIRANVVMLEALYCAITCHVDHFSNLYYVLKSLRNKETVEKLEKIYMVSLSSAELEAVFDSRGNNITPQRLKRAVMLSEKFLKLKQNDRFDFSDSAHWIPIVRMIQKRHGYTHPRTEADFDTIDASGINISAKLFIDHIKLLLIKIDDSIKMIGGEIHVNRTKKRDD